MLAERTGLEPATPGVTGRYSNQLNYRSAIGLTLPSNPKKSAKTGKKIPASQDPEHHFKTNDILVGAERLELPTYAV
jgi:hypothetical protein